MAEYMVLRDVSFPVTRGPFEAPSTTTLRDATLRGTALGEGRRPAGVAPAEPVLTRETLTKSDVLSLARDPEVRALARVMPTTLIRPVESSGDDAGGDVAGGDGAGGDGDGGAAASGVTWGVRAVGADVSARTGAGVTVAVLDTGVDAAHPAFAGVTLVEQDFSGDGNGDVQGHGSHCLGTILGRDVGGTRIGVARGVGTALVGKVLGNKGSGDSLMLFRGMQWAVEQGAQVISMSLGFDFPGLVADLVGKDWPPDLAASVALEAYRGNLRMFDAVLQMMRSREEFGTGTVVVAAAGNESRREVDPDYEIGPSLPAAADGVISVGALQQPAGAPAGGPVTGLSVARFSNTFPQVSAPGVKVLSVKAGGGLVALNGTSMATPHVAGVAALWWEEVLASPVPARTSVVTAKLVARARTDVFAAGVDVADRGAGLVCAP